MFKTLALVETCPRPMPTIRKIWIRTCCSYSSCQRIIRQISTIRRYTFSSFEHLYLFIGDDFEIFSQAFQHDGIGVLPDFIESRIPDRKRRRRNAFHIMGYPESDNFHL